MNIFFKILIFLVILFSQQNDYYNKQGKPSSYGIQKYIKENQDNLISEYEYRIDSIYDVYVYTDNLREFEDSEELGIFYIPDQIVISNEEKFIEYEFKNLSKLKQKTIHYSERTVKAVLFHELTHVYFNQISKIRQNNNLYVSPEYTSVNIYANAELSFGSEFVEEGICQYVTYYLNESVKPDKVVKPESIKELLDNKVLIMYEYSVYVLQDFLEQKGLKQGIEILISNKPPSYSEILNTELFFNRLK